MRIGILSDTHGWLDPKIASVFKNCNEIWHAGDIGNKGVLTELATIAPVRLVFGNIDGQDIRSIAPEHGIFKLEDLTIAITHIAGTPPKYNKQVNGFIKKIHPRILVCGHSHILKVMNDKSNNLLYINPGAAGRHGFHKIRTVIRFEITAGNIRNMEVVELGPRSKMA